MGQRTVTKPATPDAFGDENLGPPRPGVDLDATPPVDCHPATPLLELMCRIQAMARDRSWRSAEQPDRKRTYTPVR